MLEFRLCSSDQIGRAQSELQSHSHLVCRLLLEKKKNTISRQQPNTARKQNGVRPTVSAYRHPALYPRYSATSACVYSWSSSLFFFFKEPGAPGIPPFSPPRPPPD